MPGKNTWDINILKGLFSQADVNRKLGTTISHNAYSVSMIWRYERDGRYTVKSEYRLVVNSIDDHVTQDTDD